MAPVAREYVTLMQAGQRPFGLTEHGRWPGPGDVDLAPARAATLAWHSWALTLRCRCAPAPGTAASTPTSRTLRSSRKGANIPMELLPPPTQATARSGNRPSVWRH